MKFDRQGVEEATEGAAACHGPIAQAHFLEGLGVRERLSSLLEIATEAEAADLISGYERLVTGSEPDEVDPPIISSCYSLHINLQRTESRVCCSSSEKCRWNVLMLDRSWYRCISLGTIAAFYFDKQCSVLFTWQKILSCWHH